MSTMSTRADQYLDDLARMLSDTDAAERAEVLDSVREHIDSALADLSHRPTEQDVIAVLNQLGAPSEVAAQALDPERSGALLPAHPAGAAGPATSPTAEVRGVSASLAGAWVPPVAVLLIGLGALSAFAVVPLLALIGGIVLVCLSPLWSVPQKVMACVAAPLGLLPALVLAGVNVWLLSGSETSAPTAAIAVTVLALVVGIAILAWVWVLGAREAKRRAA